MSERLTVVLMQELDTLMLSLTPPGQGLVATAALPASINNSARMIPVLIPVSTTTRR